MLPQFVVLLPVLLLFLHDLTLTEYRLLVCLRAGVFSRGMFVGWFGLGGAVKRCCCVTECACAVGLVFASIVVADALNVSDGFCP
jgi:hypothetical protein